MAWLLGAHLAKHLTARVGDFPCPISHLEPGDLAVGVPQHHGENGGPGRGALVGAEGGVGEEKVARGG